MRPRLYYHYSKLAYYWLDLPLKYFESCIDYPCNFSNINKYCKGPIRLEPCFFYNHVPYNACRNVCCTSSLCAWMSWATNQSLALLSSSPYLKPHSYCTFFHHCFFIALQSSFLDSMLSLLQVPIDFLWPPLITTTLIHTTSACLLCCCIASCFLITIVQCIWIITN